MRMGDALAVHNKTYATLSHLVSIVQLVEAFFCDNVTMQKLEYALLYVHSITQLLL